LKNILFVCSGNTCRSPLAEGIARAALHARSPGKWTVSSAGTGTTDGLPASEHSIEVARRKGLDITGHRSRILDAAIVDEADLIVTMGARHRSTVGMIDGDAIDHTFVITEFCDDIDGDVPDPIGGDEDTYERIYVMIERCVNTMIENLTDGWKPSGI
jgi:protein-tyrosine phosphatase